MEEPQHSAPEEISQNPEQETPGNKKTKSKKNELLEWAKALFIALILAVFITQVVIVNAQVPSESMENTIEVGDRLIGFRLAYLFSEPKRGDIVIFYFPDDEQQLFIKRIIGLPGEKVEIKDGNVYINDAEQPLDSSYVKDPLIGNYGPYYVPEDSYFMLGDNRQHSRDSRYWDNKFVARNKIIAKAFFRIFPNPSVLH